MGTGESISGVLLTVGTAGSAGFDDLRFQVGSSFADQATLASQRAESQSARREPEVLADRERIAPDLHDHVTQRLFAIGLGMQGTHRRANSTVVADRLGEHSTSCRRSSTTSAVRSSTGRPIPRERPGCEPGCVTWSPS